MTAKRRLEENSIKGLLIVILFLFLSLKSCVAMGQTMAFPDQEYGYTEDRYLLSDSTIEKTGNPLYLGYELALGRPIYTLKSDLTELNQLRVSNLGVIVGGVVANKFGKLKANAGLFYSDASLPYSFDLFTGGLSANVYLLRIGNQKYRSVEPYFIASVSQQHISFYGNYLDQIGTHNYSTSEEQFLGRGVTTQYNVGLGAEYQLENGQGDFIHLFAEVAYGVPFATRCNSEIFDRTRIINPVSVNVGISFGKIKQRSK
ncbi:MAG: hypothetical protein AB7O48_16815 [Cyclobacteriaceae bacterium]